jgi:hypothetical protein
MKRTLALFLLTFVCGVVSDSASVLYGRVIEVHDGRTVTFENEKDAAPESHRLSTHRCGRAAKRPNFSTPV